MDKESYRIIRVLPQDLQNKIAAGEVVERPASVVKELLENSLDSGAKKIEVTYEDAGRTSIRVNDDGCGMDKEEMLLAVSRHATSKISDITDLENIASFGFRGEALPSIASVSRLRMQSIKKGDKDASFIELLHGQLIESGLAAQAAGTMIEVRDLFGNVPARLKFLKSPNTESARISEVFYRLALGRPEVSLRLSSSSGTIYRFPAGNELLSRLKVVWPPAVTEGLIPFEEEIDGWLIRGLAGRPEKAQARAGRMLFYVGKRAVEDRLIMRAVRDAYSGRLISREYPQIVIFLDPPPGEVDINVHPAKAEVRFRDERRLFSLVRMTVSRALEREQKVVAPFSSLSVTEEITLPMDSGGELEKVAPDSRILLQDNRPQFDSSQNPVQVSFSSPPLELRENAGVPYQADNVDSGFPPQTIEKDSLKNLGVLQEDIQRLEREMDFADNDEVKLPPNSGSINIMGQILNSYIVLELENGSLGIIDQHAAHERVLFEASKKSPPLSRPLAVPIRMSMHRAEREVLEELWSSLHTAGFELETEGPEILVIKSLPADFSAGEGRELLAEALAADKSKNIENLEYIRILSACRRAIKAGDTLSAAEMASLIDLWRTCPGREYCPHGRPVLVVFEQKDLEKMFKRRS